MCYFQHPTNLTATTSTKLCLFTWTYFTNVETFYSPKLLPALIMFSITFLMSSLLLIVAAVGFGAQVRKGYDRDGLGLVRSDNGCVCKFESNSTYAASNCPESCQSLVATEIETGEIGWTCCIGSSSRMMARSKTNNGKSPIFLIPDGRKSLDTSYVLKSSIPVQKRLRSISRLRGQNIDVTSRCAYVDCCICGSVYCVCGVCLIC